MLDFGTAIDLLKQYGYSSTTSHPYLYQTDDAIGICYLYNDDEFGALERVKIFKDIESFEEFLKEIEWLKSNGVQNHVRMILDNYESMTPKVMYLRNEKLMVEGEMFEIENFDFREAQRESMDEISKVIYEAGDLLLVYDEMKGRQLQYLKNIIKLKNSLRQKYFDLQKEVDEYNKYKITRELRLLPEVADSGINETLEIALKDKYNMYIAERPPYEEACEFLKEVWDMCKQLESNLKYYDAQKEENDVHNELKIVNQKLELLNKLNDEGRPLFGVDLVGRFRKINKECMAESSSISQEWIFAQVENIERKYSVFDHIDIINTSDYLREAIQNSNYDDLAIKYRKGVNIHDIKRARTPLNEVAASLSVQYSNSLTSQEQAILVLYNNDKYRKLCDAILRVENFETLPIKKVISIISKTKEYSKVKSIVYDAVKKRVTDSLNESIRNSLFSQFDFTTYETFIKSIIDSLIQLKNINTKMTLCGDINMYITVDSINEINYCKFVNVTNALNDLLGRTKGSKTMIGIVLLKGATPVLYSPYYLDIGDVYNKGASLQMYIKEMVDFELLVDCSDIIVNIDPKMTNVVRYYSVPKTIEDFSVVTELKMSYKTTFCKYAFNSRFIENAVSNPVVVSTSVVNQGDMANQVVNNNVSNDLPLENGGLNLEVSNPVQYDNTLVSGNMAMPVLNSETVDNVSEISDIPNVEVSNVEMPVVLPDVQNVEIGDISVSEIDNSSNLDSTSQPVVSDVAEEATTSDLPSVSSDIELPVKAEAKEEADVIGATTADDTTSDVEVKPVIDEAVIPIIPVVDEDVNVEVSSSVSDIPKEVNTEGNKEELSEVKDDNDIVKQLELPMETNAANEDKKEDNSKDKVEDKNKSENEVKPVAPVIGGIDDDINKPKQEMVKRPIGNGARPVMVDGKPLPTGVKRPIRPGMPVRREGDRQVPNGIKVVSGSKANGGAPVRMVKQQQGVVRQNEARPVSPMDRSRVMVRRSDGRIVRTENGVPPVRLINGIKTTGPVNGERKAIPSNIKGVPNQNRIVRSVDGEKAKQGLINDKPVLAEKREIPVRNGVRPNTSSQPRLQQPLKSMNTTNGNTSSRPLIAKDKKMIPNGQIVKRDGTRPINKEVGNQFNEKKENVGSVNNEKS